MQTHTHTHTNDSRETEAENSSAPKRRDHPSFSSITRNTTRSTPSFSLLSSPPSGARERRGGLTGHRRHTHTVDVRALNNSLNNLLVPQDPLLLLIARQRIRSFHPRVSLVYPHPFLPPTHTIHTGGKNTTQTIHHPPPTHRASHRYVWIAKVSQCLLLPPPPPPLPPSTPQHPPLPLSPSLSPLPPFLLPSPSPSPSPSPHPPTRTTTTTPPPSSPWG